MRQSTLPIEVNSLISKLGIIPLKTMTIKNMYYILYEDNEDVRLLSVFKDVSNETLKRSISSFRRNSESISVFTNVWEVIEDEKFSVVIVLINDLELISKGSILTIKLMNNLSLSESIEGDSSFIVDVDLGTGTELDISKIYISDDCGNEIFNRSYT